MRTIITFGDGAQPEPFISRMVCDVLRCNPKGTHRCVAEDKEIWMPLQLPVCGELYYQFDLFSVDDDGEHVPGLDEHGELTLKLFQ